MSSGRNGRDHCLEVQKILGMFISAAGINLSYHRDIAFNCITSWPNPRPPYFWRQRLITSTNTVRRLRITKMCYFILLIGLGTKYRTRLIITSPACQVHRHPSHLEPALHISTIIPAQNSSYWTKTTVRLPVFCFQNGRWSNMTVKFNWTNAAKEWPSTSGGLVRAQTNHSSI